MTRTIRKRVTWSALIRTVQQYVLVQCELLAVVSRTMQPASLSLWLRSPNTGRSRNDAGTIGR